MAPEILLNKEQKQTTKVDVWSLFATLAWVGDAADFRSKEKALRSCRQTIDAVRAAAEVFHQLKRIAEEEPCHRASAAQILVLHYKGKGLTTPRNNVPPLTTIAAPVAVDPAPE